MVDFYLCQENIISELTKIKLSVDLYFLEILFFKKFVYKGWQNKRSVFIYHPEKILFMQIL